MLEGGEFGLGVGGFLGAVAVEAVAAEHGAESGVGGVVGGHAVDGDGGPWGISGQGGGGGAAGFFHVADGVVFGLAEADEDDADEVGPGGEDGAGLAFLAGELGGGDGAGQGAGAGFVEAGGEAGEGLVLGEEEGEGAGFGGGCGLEVDIEHGRSFGGIADCSSAGGQCYYGGHPTRVSSASSAHVQTHAALRCSDTHAGRRRGAPLTRRSALSEEFFCRGRMARALVRARGGRYIGGDG